MTDRINAPSGYTRRNLLLDLGKAGGVGLMYSAMGAMGLFAPPAGAAPVSFVPPPPPRGGRGSRVVVIGAGIAGLTSAYELSKVGYTVTLLEGRDRVGGRNWTVRGGDSATETDGITQTCQFDSDQYMNAGPARLPQHHVTIDYCRELGVPLEIFTNQNADAYYYNETTPAINYGPLSGVKVRHRTAKADLYGYMAELLTKATNQGALDAQLSSQDKQLLVAFMSNFGNLQSGTYQGSPRRGYTTPPGAGSQSGVVALPPYGLSEMLQSRFGLNFSFEFGWDQAMLMFQPVGGMDAIPKALERAIRPRVRSIYGANVSGIYNTEGGVRVVYADGSRVAKQIEADYCICTIPPQILKRIPSNFSTEVINALGVAGAQSTGKIGLQYRRRFWEEDDKIMGGITNTNLNLSTIWYPSYGYLGRKGVVVGYYNFGANADFYSNLNPAAREREALLQGSKIHGPAYTSELENSFSVSWIKTPFSEGGWVNWPTAGGQRVPAYDLLNRPEGRVYFAGDHLSYYIAWQAGAFDSARKVVMEIGQRVGA
ncbi:MAG: flavin monoamine oxidase family protein [Burkholderiaceae bacterium]|jgi:monoamine oxidase|nr:flavin monoamine oxidase family protein [Burkholderiaceae bacterium]